MINASMKTGTPIIITSNYYKVIVIRIGTFESKIVDERHFKRTDEATSFMEQNTSDSTTCLLLAM